MKKIIFSTSISSALLFSNSPENLFELSLEQLMNIEVTTASKYSELISNSPANIYLFTKQTIKERNYQNVEDILESLPSIDINKYSRSLARDDISMRGTNGNNKFLILLNGIRISSPTGETIHIGNNFPITYAKQVEVVLGAASVMYGADAYMGVVNIITESDTDLVELKVSASLDDYRNSFANLSQNIGDLHINAFISGYQSQDYTLGDDYPDIYTQQTPANDFDFAKTKDTNFFANISSKSFELGVKHFEHEASLDFLLLPDRSSFDENSKDKDRLTTIYAKYNFDITNYLHSNTLISYSQYEKDESTYFNNEYTMYAPLQKGYKYAKNERYTLNQDFSLKKNANILSFGLSYDYINMLPLGTDLDEPYDTSKSSTNQDLYYSGTNILINFHETSYNNFGIYLQDDYKFSEDLNFIIGLRYDYNSLYDDTFNPRASMIYNIDQNQLLKLMYSSAFLAPASDQLYREYGYFDSSGTTAPFYHIANEDLKPENLQTIELNYEHFLKTTHIKLAPYFTYIKNKICEEYIAGANNTTSIPGATIIDTQQFVNSGNSTIYGMDISLDDTSEIANFKFKCWLALSYTHSIITKDNKTTDTPQIAPFKAKGGSSIIYNEQVSITPKLFYVGKSSTADINIDTPSYFYADINLQYKATKHLSIGADIYNLLDNRYLNAPSGSDRYMIYEGAPQPGRLITASLYYKY